MCEHPHPFSDPPLSSHSQSSQPERLEKHESGKDHGQHPGLHWAGDWVGGTASLETGFSKLKKLKPSGHIISPTWERPCPALPEK